MSLSRRNILKSLLVSTVSVLAIHRSGNAYAQNVNTKASRIVVAGGHEAPLADGFNLGCEWEGLNPGYWHVESGLMRRVVRSIGDRARNTGFPFHYESQVNPEGVMPIEYDPTLPMGVIWNRHWKLSGNFGLKLSAKVKGLTSLLDADDDGGWNMYQPGYGLVGLAFGGDTQFESFYPSPDASPLFLVKEDGTYGLMRYSDWEPMPVTGTTIGRVSPLAEGDVIELSVSVTGCDVSAEISVNGKAAPRLHWKADAGQTEGWFGLAARGLLDVEVAEISVEPDVNKKLSAPLNDCHVCYPLGDTLRETKEGWVVRFMGLFRNDGERAEIRVADTPNPKGGWDKVAVAGSAMIISNDFRRNTAVIDVVLPDNPADKTMYYTVWKGGENVTSDPRIGTASVGPGTGLVADTPTDGVYVGRLPRLVAPYRLCGLSCHAVHTAAKADLAGAEGGACGPRIVGAQEGTHCGIDKPFYVHDQPCEGAFQHLEDFNYQIMLWEDDVWYMELLLYPPSTDDAYKIVTTSIAGPTTRWQMMRHWNVLNPGDHDHGMDDVKGPEQLLIRNRNDLGQDPSYMVRNFQIVSHLMTGKENPSGKDNPKRWRSWKMPNRDFTLMVMDSRLWRTSQDTAIWDDEGWGKDKEIYNREDPTRTLLGEEQFAWLTQELRTDSSPLICLTGINVLHTIWGGHKGDGWLNSIIDRDRVSADYAGWVKAGADRIIDLISGRGGVVSVYGDVHAGSIVRNTDKHFYECSFGPIGRWGGRSLIEGFGRKMKDFDGRPIEVISLYHDKYKNPDLELQETVNYWNVLDATFDSSQDDAEINLVIRNITDKAKSAPRGGAAVRAKASEMGRVGTASLPKVRTLKNADLLFLTRDGDPIRGARSLSDGIVPISTLSDVSPGDEIIILATKGTKTKSQLVRLGAV